MIGRTDDLELFFSVVYLLNTYTAYTALFQHLLPHHPYMQNMCRTDFDESIILAVNLFLPVSLSVCLKRTNPSPATRGRKTSVR